MDVRVKTISGDNFSITVAPDDTVATMKASVAAVREGIDAALVKLIFAGKVLTDDCARAGELGLNDPLSFLVLMVSKPKKAKATSSVAAAALAAAPVAAAAPPTPPTVVSPAPAPTPAPGPAPAPAPAPTPEAAPAVIEAAAAPVAAAPPEAFAVARAQGRR